MLRLAIVTSHPIQYQAPFFRALAQSVDLEVFFCHQQTAAGQAAAGFGVEFEWDVPLLDGYQYSFLKNRSSVPDVSTFGGCDTPEIADRLAAGRFDACMVSGWYLKSYLQSIRAARRLGIGLLCRGDSQLATRRSRLWQGVKYWPYRWLLGAIDAHLYVGAANRQYLQHYGVSSESLFFAPHFVDNQFFSQRADAARVAGRRDVLRHEWGFTRDTTVFAFAGKLIGKKRPADLILALAESRARGADAVGLIIGSGALESHLRQLAVHLSVPVAFVGFRNQSELPGYLVAADALVLPSDAGETWGLVVNEAMACGVPAIVSDACGCSHDLIAEGETGYRFPSGDVSALASQMSTMVGSLSGSRARLQASIAATIARYSCDAAVAGTMTALSAVH